MTHLIGQLKEIPGVLIQGKTIAEVKESIQDALVLYLVDMREDTIDNEATVFFQRGSRTCLANQEDRHIH